MSSGPRKIRSSFSGAAPQPEAQEEAEPAPKAVPAAPEAAPRPGAKAKKGDMKKADALKVGAAKSSPQDPERAVPAEAKKPGKAAQGGRSAPSAGQELGREHGQEHGGAGEGAEPTQGTQAEAPSGGSPPADQPEPSPFLEALAELLESRQLAVPPGLLEAPPAAYAGQGAGTVQMMARLKDEDLAERAGKVAGWQARQEERARWAWDSSPLIRELRGRGLPVPERPARVGAMAVSLKRPLAEWSDGELVAAVTEWTRLGER